MTRTNPVDGNVIKTNLEVVPNHIG